ncbi:hypothetical protein ACSBQ0_18365 [Bacillus altitudinis]|uniref:hypothetical protein n=1 Tax=Bacillus TaxID=1386 RepID=UPI002106C3E9|nr:hypothetical protein [Bacillus sp. FS02]
MSKNNAVVISVVINGEADKMKKLEIDAIANRIDRVIKGEKVEALNASDTERRCDGIDIGGFICIGSSRD